MEERKILTDHKRVKKKLIPPFVYKLGPQVEIPWIKIILPELLWIAIIHDLHGYKNGVNLILTLSKMATNYIYKEGTNIKLFGTISSFSVLSEKAEKDILKALKVTNSLDDICFALKPLISLYPECPLKFLFDNFKIKESEFPQYVDYLKTIIIKLYDKRSTEAVFMQATFIYLAINIGILHVSKNVSLSNFPEVEKYPNTEMSKRVAASVRATVPILFCKTYYSVEDSFWPFYFWNHGIEISPCTFLLEGGEK